MSATGAPRRIAVIGGTPAVLEKARAAGFTVVWVHAPGELDRRGLDLAEQAVLTDYRQSRRVARLLAAVHEETPLERVVSLTEDGLESAGAATTALDLPGSGHDAVRVLRDRVAFGILLRANGIDTVASRLGHDEAALAAFVAEFGPTVVKPRFGCGSAGVRLVEGPGAVGAAAAWAAARGLRDFVMQEYLSGPEIGVECFSIAGRHEVLAHTRGRRPPAGDADGPPAVPDGAATAAVDDLVTRMLDVAGVTDGPSHTAVVITGAGPRLVEAHNRRGGDRAGAAVREVYGVDADALAFRWYAATAGPPAHLPPAGQDTALHAGGAELIGAAPGSPAGGSR